MHAAAPAPCFTAPALCELHSRSAPPAPLSPSCLLPRLDLHRPNGEYDVGPAVGQPVGLEIVRGDVVSEARQVFSDWTTLITRCNGG